MPRLVYNAGRKRFMTMPTIMTRQAMTKMAAMVSKKATPAGTNSVTINDVAAGTTVKAIVEHDGYMPSNIRAVKYTATP